MNNKIKSLLGGLLEKDKLNLYNVVKQLSDIPSELLDFIFGEQFVSLDYNNKQFKDYLSNNFNLTKTKVEALIDQFNEIVENYLIQRVLKHSNVIKRICLLEAYKYIDDQLFHKELNDILSEKNNNEPLLDHFSKHIIVNQLLEDQEDYFGKRKVTQLTPHKSEFEEIILFQKLVSTCNGLSDSKILNRKITSFNIETLRSEFQLLNQNVITQGYLLAFDLLNGFFLDQYTELKAHFIKFKSQFLLIDLNNIIGYLTTSSKYIFKSTKYHQELFQLQKIKIKAIENLTYSKLYYVEYKNFVIAAINNNELDDAEDFIEINQNRIFPISMQEETYALCKSRVFMEKHHFLAAQEILSSVNTTDTFNNLTLKFYLIKIYFETRQLELLENELHNFTRLIHYYKSKISESKIASYRKFINYTGKINRYCQRSASLLENFVSHKNIEDSKTIKNLQKMRAQIEEEPMFYGKIWLIQKIQEIC